MSDDRADHSAEDPHCPDCGGPITVLYERLEFDQPTVTFWCDGDCTGSKAAPKEDVTHAA